jgi:hypothetical protein
MTFPRLLKYLFFAVAAFAGLVVLFINANLASLAEAVYPGSLWWTHGILLCMEALAFFRFWSGIFGGHKHLLLPDDGSPEAGERFARELARRLRANPHIREAGIAPDGPEDAERVAACMALLRAKANTEIESCARRVFLAAALAQNGRLDALVVFFSLCRLVWRISLIYNQRPHPREIASLYWVVASSAFLAFSLEELDLPMEISVGFSQAFHAVAPAGLAASIPFVGKAMQTFTASAIDGAVNCYLALRAGIIARNAYDYAFIADQRPTRADVYREAGSLLLTMSASLMHKLAEGLAGGLAGVMGNARSKTVRTGKGIVQGVGRAGVFAGNAVTDAAASVVGGIGSVGISVGKAGAAATGAAASVAHSAASAARSAANTLGGIAVKPFSRIWKKKTK